MFLTVQCLLWQFVTFGNCSLCNIIVLVGWPIGFKEKDWGKISSFKKIYRLLKIIRTIKIIRMIQICLQTIDKKDKND